MIADSTSEVLVSADWVEDHLEEIQRDDPSLRVIEVDIEPSNYDDGHIPGASSLDWKRDLQDTVTFDVPTIADFEALLGEAGVTADSTIVLYGDMMNWFAAHAYWLLTYYRHADVRLLDGGRDYWVSEDYPLTDEVPSFTEQSYSVSSDPDGSIRADHEDVVVAMDEEIPMIDVRTPEEYRGEIIAPPGWNEGVQRGGHIPGATNIPWSNVVEADGRFKSLEDLRELFAAEGIEREGSETDVITYCRIGERSALMWTVLHELLGYERVRNYYGSWVEWGNTVGAPIESAQRADVKRNH
ncbi:sulfurtransferase [Halococcus sp. IIIV-5B]|uniref:sulfurtransferase n=1 Tax=Halococcus sp. IIIV-5B TaxID=2321230 RepID=UPI0026BC691E